MLVGLPYDPGEAHVPTHPMLRNTISSAGRLALLGSLLAGVAACGDEGSTGPEFTEAAVTADAKGGLKSIDLTPAKVELAPGAKQQFTVVAYKANGSRMNVAVSFSATGGTISSSGLYTAGSSGGMVIASANGVRDTAWVTIAGATPPDSTPTDPPAPPPPPPSPDPVPAACSDYPHTRVVSVTNASQLASAIADARGGDLITLADGTYSGRFTLSASGSAGSRIVLCGGRGAVLNGGSTSSGNGVLVKASYWTLDGLSITNSLVGVAGIRANDNVIRNVAVYNVGQAGMHFRTFSSRNRFERNEISNTGRYKPEYGEGIYIGSFSTQWVDGPDRSNENQILDNRFGPNVTADHIDLKAATSGGVIRGNRFDGRGMVEVSGNNPAWVSVFGDRYTVERNAGSVAFKHGFKVHSGTSEYGNGNVFRTNEADVQASGWGFSIASVTSGNVVACDNVVRNASWGFGNVKCQ